MFHLQGWCMLGVFLLPAFTYSEHEYQDLVSVGWNASMHRLDLGPHSKQFIGNGVTTYVNSKRKSPVPEAQTLRNGVRTYINSKGKFPCTEGSDVREWSQNLC